MMYTRFTKLCLKSFLEKQQNNYFIWVLAFTNKARAFNISARHSDVVSFILIFLLTVFIVLSSSFCIFFPISPHLLPMVPLFDVLVCKLEQHLPSSPILRCRLLMIPLGLSCCLPWWIAGLANLLLSNHTISCISHILSHHQ